MKKIIALLLVFLMVLPSFAMTEKAKEVENLNQEFLKADFEKQISAYSNNDLISILKLTLERLHTNKGIDKENYKNIQNKLEFVEKTAIASENKTLSEKDLKKLYAKFNFKKYFRNPENFKGDKFLIQGKIVQVLGSRSDGFELRLSTRSYYDDVVYIRIGFDPGINLIEGDKLTLYCTSLGAHTYQSVQNVSITLPYFETDKNTPILIK